MYNLIFKLDPQLGTSLQGQVREMIVSAILDRSLQPGDRLPSSRELAEHLGLSRNTVTFAYRALQDDGYLIAKHRSGFYVSEDTAASDMALERRDKRHPSDGPSTPQSLRTDTVGWQNRLLSHYEDIRVLQKPLNWREYTYPFVYGQADQTLFNHSEWRDCARQALGLRNFGITAGDFGQHDDPLLVEYIRTRTLPARGIIASSDEILVTMGAQNALYLLAQLLVSDNSRVIIEEPTYPDLRDILRLRTKHLHSCPVDENGIILGGQDLTQTDLVVITPSHQCPTTATLSTDRRQDLLASATRDDFLIIEDDYEFEMNFLEKPAPALKSGDKDGRVLYVGSFSKSLFPGLRLGYLVAPAPVIKSARKLRHLMLRHPPGHLQRTAAYFLALGHYDSQIRKLRRRLAARRAVMSEALAQVGLLDTQAAKFGGTSFWVYGPPNLDTTALAAQLAEQSVLIEPGASFFFDETRRNAMRLAYSSIPASKIPAGVDLVAKAIAGR
ncbi:MAG: PLP-dependent aminotransferase family protein [Candidatus Puniceispirillaceae bacterium]